MRGDERPDAVRDLDVSERLGRDRNAEHLRDANGAFAELQILQLNVVASVCQDDVGHVSSPTSKLQITSIVVAHYDDRRKNLGVEVIERIDTMRAFDDEGAGLVIDAHDERVQLLRFTNRFGQAFDALGNF